MSASTPEKCRRWMVVGMVAWILAAGFSPGLVVGQPIILEVLYDGPGSDADDVFTEIFGTAGTSLDGWTLVGINGDSGSAYRTVDLTGAVIPADGVLVIATADAAGDVLSHRDFEAEVDWQNGPDAVQLLDPEGQIADALQYGDVGAFNAGGARRLPRFLQVRVSNAMRWARTRTTTWSTSLPRPRRLQARDPLVQIPRWQFLCRIPLRCTATQWWFPCASPIPAARTSWPPKCSSATTAIC